MNYLLNGLFEGIDRRRKDFERGAEKVSTINYFAIKSILQSKILDMMDMYRLVVKWHVRRELNGLNHGHFIVNQLI